MKSRVKIVLGLGVAAMAALGAFWAYNGFLVRAKPMEDTVVAAEGGPKERVVHVKIEPLVSHDFEDRLVLQGTVEAKEIALVPARIGGTLQTIYVDEGDVVIAGKTLLFATDSLSAEKRVEIARRELAVSGFSSKEKEASRDRVEANLRKVSLDHHRFERLFEKKAVTKDALERFELAYLQASAELRHSESLVSLGTEQERLARAALAIAEKDLADTQVIAPISGHVSRRFMEPGEWGGPKNPVLRIENLSVVEISAYIPEAYYQRVIAGETPMRVRAGGADLGEMKVDYKSPTVHRSLRTFEIKGVVQSPPDSVVPGKMATIEVILSRREAHGVRRESIVTRNTGPAVFYVVGGVARLAQVKTGLDADGYVEITGGNLPAGAAVVTMGQSFLDEGTSVQVKE